MTVHKPTSEDPSTPHRPRVDAQLHVRGRARYAADQSPHGCLHAVPVLAQCPSGRLTSVDYSKASASDGVILIVDANSIRGLNSYVVVGGRLREASVFVNERVDYAGQAVALVLGEEREAAVRAARLVRVQVEAEAKEAIVGFDEAIRRCAETRVNGDEGRTTVGHVDEAFRDAATIRGSVKHGGQLHQPTESQVSGCWEKMRHR